MPKTCNHDINKTFIITINNPDASVGELDPVENKNIKFLFENSYNLYLCKILWKLKN